MFKLKQENLGTFLTVLAFLADSEKRTPLFPTIPIGYPNILANPQKKMKKEKKMYVFQRAFNSSQADIFIHCLISNQCLKCTDFIYGTKQLRARFISKALKSGIYAFLKGLCDM